MQVQLTMIYVFSVLNKLSGDTGGKAPQSRMP